MSPDGPTALELARDTSRQVLTLTTAVLSLSIAFYKDVLGPPLTNLEEVVLQSSWVALAASLLVGIVTLMMLIRAASPLGREGQRSQASPPSVDSTAVRWAAIVQLASFGAGMVGLVAVGWLAV